MPSIKWDGALVSGDDFQFQTTPTEFLATHDDFAEKERANTATAPLWPHVKLLEPADPAAVLRAEMSGRVGEPDKLSFIRREQDEAVARIGNDHARHLAQVFGWRCDIVLL